MAATKKQNPGQEALRKLLLAGIGLADETNQKLSQNFNALVKKGQAREPELKKVVADARKRVDEKRKELEKKVTDFFKQNEIVKSAEFQKLLKKVEEFQKKANRATTNVAKKAEPAKKTVTPAKKAAPKRKKPAAKKPANTAVSQTTNTVA